MSLDPKQPANRNRPTIHHKMNITLGFIYLFIHHLLRQPTECN